MGQTVKPSGVKISRNKNAFSASWTRKKSPYKEKNKTKHIDYSNQWYKKAVKRSDQRTKWVPASGNGTKIAGNKSSVNNFQTLNFRSFYPFTGAYLNGIKFTIKADTKKHSMSPASPADDYNLSVPNGPSVSVSEETYPSATFSYSVSGDDAGAAVFTRFDCYSVLVSDSNGSVPGHLWNNLVQVVEGVNGSGEPNGVFSGSWYTTPENTSQWTKDTSYTRWFGVATRGPKGTGGTATSYITYANPFPPVIIKPTDTNVSDKGNGLSVYMQYTIDRSFSHPISSIVPQYLIAKPETSDLDAPDSGWTDVRTVLPPDGFDNIVGSLTFDTPNKIPDNQCLWVRAISKYSEKQNATATGAEMLFKTGILSPPENVSCGAIDPDSYRAIVRATNNTDVSGSFVAVYHVRNSEETCLGIIPNGQTETTIQFSSYVATPIIRFYTVVGDYERANAFKLSEDTEVYVPDPSNPDDAPKYYFQLIEDQYVLVVNPTGSPVDKGYYEIDGTSLYNITKNNWSSTSVDYEVELKTPTRVTTERTDVSGTIRVGWDWPWSSANLAEISWADHKDAWQSTSEPSKYEISNARASYWNISGLDSGKIWYIRVRLGIKDSSETVYGPYTKIYTLNLTSAPATPLIDIPEDKKVILKDEEVTISWVFSSEDGTQQQSSTLYEVFEDDGKKVYKELMTGGEEQYIILNNPRAEKSLIDWETGETHTYAITVRSQAGQVSGYSNTVSISIVDPIKCIIVDDSLVNGELTRMPFTFKVIEDYYLTTDVVVDPDKDYYERSDIGEYTYEEIESIENPRYKEVNDPIGNPSEEGWYEYDEVEEEYVLTQDTEIDPDKIYYEKFEENPKTNGWYEYDEVEEEYVPTQDTEMVSGKDYYRSVGEPIYIYDLVESPSGNPRTNEYYERKALESNISIHASIIRNESFRLDRPDDSTDQGFDKETIYSGESLNGDFSVDVTNEGDSNVLVGSLDDRCEYLLKVFIKDDKGQSNSAELPFIVNWEHQAGFPEARVEVDNEETVAFLTPLAPHTSINYILTEDQEVVVGKTYYTIDQVSETSEDDIDDYLEQGESNYYYTIDTSIDPEKTYYMAESVDHPVVEDLGSYYEQTIIESAKTDVCDIYRLSVDKPELIYSDATFGETYVDPYPTIGEYGGHRFVCKTVNGDYTTADGTIAWVDTTESDGDRFETHGNIIDFDGEQAFLLYEVDLSSSWSKDFQETKYLGGSVQGDWNPGVSRTSSINVTAVSDYDQELIRTMHRLANYPGVCHVRTKDGGSYSADVQVNETYEYTRAPRFNKYDLTITRVDSESLDGITLKEWIERQGEASE